MNSALHSSVPTSADVAVLPPINNHINHIESPNKSLKRSRSPSLTGDDNEDTNHSSTVTDTPTKKSRKKRTTTDVDESLGFVANNIYLQKFTCIFIFLDNIYLPINYMSIDGQLMNHTPNYMCYKNKYVTIFHWNRLNENILVSNFLKRIHDRTIVCVYFVRYQSTNGWFAWTRIFKVSKCSYRNAMWSWFDGTQTGWSLRTDVHRLSREMSCK